MLGKTVGGRYQIIRFLGGGGFGRTYLAEDWHLPGKPQCVVKQLNPQVTDEKGLLAAKTLFDREARVLYMLGNHDQIPKLFAHFEEQREFYLVQEFIEGEVLSRELRERRILNEDEVITLLQDILVTLEFVHQQGVIHRDIKPSNLIRRSHDQKIVLIDFGAVKQFGHQPLLENEAQTTITIAIGSLGYIPNEQLAGKPRCSSDIYAVGMVGLRALTGLYPSQLPDDPRTGEILWRDHATVSPELADILDKMIRYDFRQRYQSASEALAALNHIAPPHHTTVILPTTQATNSDSHLVWIERGDELFQIQRFREAIACYDKALQDVTDDYMVWFKRAMALENLREFEVAIESYDQVLQLHSEDYLAWFKRGKALEQLKRYDAAIECYDKVIELQPDNYWAWHDRGRVLEESQQFEQAAASYDRTVQLKPSFSLAIEGRKRVLSQLRQVDQLYGLQHYEEAIASCERKLKIKPDDALSWLMRGMALEKLHQYEAAVHSYERVVKLQPDDHLAWFKRGTLLEHLKRYKEAVLSYNKVVQLQPENYWVWNDRGRVLETIDRHELALASYDKAMQIKPDFEPAVEGRRRMLNYLKQGSRPQTTAIQTAVQAEKTTSIKH